MRTKPISLGALGAAAFLGALSLAPGAAQAITVTQTGLGMAPPAAESNNGFNTNSQEVGYRFELLRNATLTGLGFYASHANPTFGANSTVKLWDSTGAIVASRFINGLTAGAWNFRPLDMAMELEPGVYTVSYSTLAGGVGTTYSFTDEIPSPSSIISLQGAVANDEQNMFPGSPPLDNAVYLADVQFSVEIPEVPLPATLPLGLAAMAGLGLAARRRKA